MNMSRYEAPERRTLPRSLPTLIMVGLALAFSFGFTEEGEGQETAPPILIRNVTVIDGTGAGPNPGMDVTLQGGTIASIKPHEEEVTFEGRIIEAKGQFLIPGIIDAHTHLSGSNRRANEVLFRWILEGGVTSVRDMAGDARDMAGIQRALISGELTGPSVYYSALMAGPEFMEDPRLVAATKGYPLGESPYMIPLTSETDLVRTVAMAKGTGATGVKLYAALSAELVEAATAEAHRMGMRVWGHSAIFPAKPVEISNAGVDGVSHAPYVIWEGAPPTADFTLRAKGDFKNIPADGPDMDRVIEAMVRNGTLLDPTLFYFSRGTNDPLARQRLAWGATFTERAHQAGVTIVAGTDDVGRPLAGALPNIHSEMEVLVELAGLSPLEALTAGTLAGAMAIGNQDTVGSIEPGKVADLVLLSADPSRDIRNTRAIVRVIQGGELVR